MRRDFEAIASVRTSLFVMMSVAFAIFGACSSSSGSGSSERFSEFRADEEGAEDRCERISLEDLEDAFGDVKVAIERGTNACSFDLGAGPNSEQEGTLRIHSVSRSESSAAFAEFYDAREWDQEFTSYTCTSYVAEESDNSYTKCDDGTPAGPEQTQIQIEMSYFEYSSASTSSGRLTADQQFIVHRGVGELILDAID